MPADRLFHPRLGHSDKVTLLTDFEYRVWSQYILSADDFGVLRCSAVTLQSENDALGARKPAVVQRALDRLITVQLVQAYEHQGRGYVCQRDWQAFQKVEYPRTTFLPKPPDELLSTLDESTRELFVQHPGGLRKGAATTGVLTQNERYFREVIADALPRILSGVQQVTQNVRLGNSYADLVVTRTNQRLTVIEVKRYTIYKSALAQVTGYGAVMRAQYPAHDVELIVFGRGVAPSLTPADLQAGAVTIVTTDDALNCAVVYRHATNDLPGNFSLSSQKFNVNPTVTDYACAPPRETANANGCSPDRSFEKEKSDPVEVLRLRAGELVQHFAELHMQYLKGAKYRSKPALDWQEALTLVPLWTDERLEKLAILVLTTDDDWISKTDRSFHIFALKASWADQQLTKWEAAHPERGE